MLNTSVGRLDVCLLNMRALLIQQTTSEHLGRLFQERERDGVLVYHTFATCSQSVVNPRSRIGESHYTRAQRTFLFGPWQDGVPMASGKAALPIPAELTSRRLTCGDLLKVPVIVCMYVNMQSPNS